MSDYFICPNCGAEVSLKALACPECGSDENTGWSEDTMYDYVDLPDAEESSTQTSASLFQNKYFLYIVAIITFLAFLWIYVL
ncbi:MAG: zinc-ribbon domain-containing protein [Candidatus Scalinduaceae bacterium]